MSAESGASFGSCFTFARRYWSRTFSRHARLQFSGIGPVEAWTGITSLAATATAATKSANRTTRMSVLQFLILTSYFLLLLLLRQCKHVQRIPGRRRMNVRRDGRGHETRAAAAVAGRHGDVLAAVDAERHGKALHRRAETRLPEDLARLDRKSTRLNSSHTVISYAVFCLKKKKISMIIYRYND